MLPTPIHHTFGPLATSTQCKEAFCWLLQPWRWRQGGQTEALREALQRMFERQAYLFASGRQALLAGLQALQLEPQDEVLIQGYTCVAVPNAVIAAGGKPVYVDVDPDTLNLDLDATEKAISARTRAIICQHTFGIPADTKRLRALCNVHKLALIEDCAHVIPSDTQGDIGKYADCLVLSFGRDKAVSGVTGGAVLTQHEMLNQTLKQLEAEAQPLGLLHIKQLLLYPLHYQLAKWLWPLGLGKLYLKLLQLTKLLPPVLRPTEKQGQMPAVLHQLPNACAALALNQGSRLEALNAHRQQLSTLYQAAADKHNWRVPLQAKTAVALQKFPVYVPNADTVRTTLKQEQIYLDDGWCGAVVNPRTVDPDSVRYRKHSCRQAERIAEQILSLPTHPTTTVEDAEDVIEELNALLHNQESGTIPRDDH